MGTKLQAGAISFDSSQTSIALSGLQFETINVSGVGFPSLATMDMEMYNISGGLLVGYAKPVNNAVYPRFTPVDASGNVVPYALSAQWQYASSYSDTGQQNLTGAFNAGLQVYNTGNTPCMKFVIEGGGFGWTTYDVAPAIMIRSVYQYSNWTVHRIDAITLGTGAASSNTDIRKIRLSFSSGNFYGGSTYRVFAV